MCDFHSAPSIDMIYEYAKSKATACGYVVLNFISDEFDPDVRWEQSPDSAPNRRPPPFN